MAGTKWKHVADHVNERMRHLSIDQAELVRRSGLSTPTVAGIMNGTPRAEQPRAKGLWAICAALGWSQASIADILAGGQPTVDGEPSAGGVSQPDGGADRRFERLEQQIVDVSARTLGAIEWWTEEQRAVVEKMEVLTQRVAALEAPAAP